MLNVGTGELILIAVAALLILGPKGLPDLARGLGKFMREFRRQTDDVRTVVEREFYRMDQPEVPEIHKVPDAVPAHAEPEPEATVPPATGGMTETNVESTAVTDPTAEATAPTSPKGPSST